MFRVGQKVVCINSNQHPTRKLPEGFKFPIKDKIYTIRNIYNIRGVIGVTLEEIINDIHPRTGLEIGYSIDRFRSLLDNGLLSHLLGSIVEEKIDHILVPEKIEVEEEDLHLV